jgi:hypothetical protein
VACSLASRNFSQDGRSISDTLAASFPIADPAP